MVYWNYGVLACEPVLVAQALEDALGGVSLPLGDAEVIFKDPVPADYAGEGLQLRAAGRNLPPVADGTGKASILRTVSRRRPNTREVCRMRSYTSTWHIHRTFHRLGFTPVESGRRYGFQPPQINQPIRPRGLGGNEGIRPAPGVDDDNAG